jgi:hypothetical protein
MEEKLRLYLTNVEQALVADFQLALQSLKEPAKAAMDLVGTLWSRSTIALGTGALAAATLVEASGLRVWDLSRLRTLNSVWRGGEGLYEDFESSVSHPFGVERHRVTVHLGQARWGVVVSISLVMTQCSA